MHLFVAEEAAGQLESIVGDIRAKAVRRHDGVGQVNIKHADGQVEVLEFKDGGDEHYMYTYTLDNWGQTQFDTLDEVGFYIRACRGLRQGAKNLSELEKLRVD